jgi:hypothetical protein
MSLANVAYNASLTWADPTLQRLESQALIPIFGEHPVELGLGGKDEVLLARLRADAGLAVMFATAFPGADELISIDNVTRAIAAFERTLISGDSPYDRLVYRGEMNALSESAWRGVIEHYAAGGRTIEAGPYRGVGRDNPHKSKRLQGFTMSRGEEDDLVAFLECLTDERFVTEPRFGAPVRGESS